MDDYYRTFEGFAVLIEKEWVSMGHKFQQRMSIGGKDDSDMSPVFLQWLDCVHQVIIQNPRSFTFTDTYLLDIFNAVISAKYGNFLCNSEKERVDRSVYKRTCSAWPDLIPQSLHAIKVEAGGAITCKFGAPHLTTWNAFWLRFNQ
jgi:hypothetical protein